MDIAEDLIIRNFDREFIFAATRSRGPGGQNVNKVNTRIELRFSIGDSRKLSEIEKVILLNKLKRRINSEGDLIIISQSERSQVANKKKAVEKFYNLLSKALVVRPARIQTSPTALSKTKRIESKRKRSAIKKLRGRSEDFPEE